MRIGFFLQNSKQGGLDTFVIQLLQNWPEDDGLILFCNGSHPGLETLRQNVPASEEFQSYNFLVHQDFDRRFRSWPTVFSRLLKIVFWAVGFVYQVNVIKSILAGADLDRLLIINGGYPAGDACQAATVVWATINPERRAWHNFHNFSAPLPKSLLRRWHEHWIDKKVARYTRGFVSVSRFCRDSIKNRPEMHDVEKRFIYNGMEPLVPTYDSSLINELSIAYGIHIILMLGTYESRKGHAFIIQVMEHIIDELPDVHLLICGDGSEDEVKVVEDERQKSRVATNIHLQGHRSDIENLLAQTDLIVVPSQAYESFGYMALEAMCCRVPVVVTNVGGLPEVVEDGVCGYVVEHRDVEGFARRIVELLHDDNLRHRMGGQGHRRYEQHFTAERMARLYADLVRM